ncbi:hypothetical protein SAMN04487936_102149 [Halobacillus dabanensis]|uniref:Uncharacterized protein n=1 Tax=Halobacillus dabanensis TaxID=240302 RepID=A0A1I3RDK9_HALDA|nr:hypothetical protein SAMN04487936_102149 [Halobacillus dabanensis]
MLLKGVWVNFKYTHNCNYMKFLKGGWFTGVLYKWNSPMQLVDHRRQVKDNMKYFLNSLYLLKVYPFCYRIR